MNFFARLFRKKEPAAPPVARRPIIQFLIRRADGEWFDLHANRFGEVLKPSSVPSRAILGWGDHRIEIQGCEVSFSYEDPGIQVCFESGEISEEQARGLVDEIASSITAATGQQSRVVPL